MPVPLRPSDGDPLIIPSGLLDALLRFAASIVRLKSFLLWILTHGSRRKQWPVHRDVNSSAPLHHFLSVFLQPINFGIWSLTQNRGCTDK
jgi:hypothetical protein